MLRRRKGPTPGLPGKASDPELKQSGTVTKALGKVGDLRPDMARWFCLEPNYQLEGGSAQNPGITQLLDV